MIEGGLQANEVVHQELLRKHRESFGGIRELNPDVEVEARRLDGYRDLFFEVFPDMIQLPEEELFQDFRAAVNNSLLICLETTPQITYISPEGNPHYLQTSGIPTPRQAEAVILAFGLLDGEKVSAIDRAKQVKQAKKASSATFQRLINSGVRNIMEGLIQGSFGERYPQFIPNRPKKPVVRRRSLSGS